MSYSTAYRGPAIGTDVPPPWVVGHRLRNLLTDVDTHMGAEALWNARPLRPDRRWAPLSVGVSLHPRGQHLGERPRVIVYHRTDAVEPRRLCAASATRETRIHLSRAEARTVPTTHRPSRPARDPASPPPCATNSASRNAAAKRHRHTQSRNHPAQA